MGQEGFSSDSSLLYHRHLPTAIVAAEEFDPPAWTRAAEPAAQAPPPAHPQARQRRRRRGPRPAAPARQRRRAASRTCSPTGPSPLYRNAIGDECLYVEAGAAARRVDLRRARRRPRATTSIIPTSVDPPDRARPARPTAAAGHRGDRAHRAAQALPVGARASSWSTRRTASATCAARPSRCSSTASDVEVLRPAPARLDPARLRQPPVRRGRLGRLPLPVGVLHPRLRADHRPGAPAAAGAPDVPGPELRDLLVRARARSTTTRWRSRCRTTTTTSTPTRCSSTPAATTRRARGSGIEQGSISLHPSGFTHGPQPGAAERSIGAELLRRAGRHGRHLPPAGPLRAGAGLRGRRLRLDLVAPRPAAEPGRGHRYRVITLVGVSRHTTRSPSGASRGRACPS